MTKKIIFKKGHKTNLDNLMSNCGHHKVFDDCNCNNGYGCLHPENAAQDYDCKNGCGGCHGYACPLAYQEDPEKDDRECNWGSDTIMVITEDIYEEEEVRMDRSKIIQELKDMGKCCFPSGQPFARRTFANKEAKNQEDDCLESTEDLNNALEEYKLT